MAFCFGTMQTQYMVNQEMTTTDTWSLIQDSNGRVLDEYSLRKVTFSKVYYLTGFTISAHAARIGIYCLLITRST